MPKRDAHIAHQHTCAQGKYILFAIYTCAVLAVIIVPATFAVGANPQTGYILRVMGICFAVVGTIGAINLPKVGRSMDLLACDDPCLLCLAQPLFIRIIQIRLIVTGVEISMTGEDGKTGATKSGSATTSSRTNTTSGAVATGTGKSQTTRPDAAGGGGGSSSGGPLGVIKVKDHVPSAVFDEMQAALAAMGKLANRQRQGFALQHADFKACVDRVRVLCDSLARCKVEEKVPAPAGGGAGKPSATATAAAAPASVAVPPNKVAPSPSSP